jgi:hypothetical protein
MREPTAARSSQTATAPVTDPDAADVVDDAGDNLSHIICFLCYPAFDGSREAPHDAFCVCGKPVRKGETPRSNAAAHCILCNELWNHHLATVHPDM